MKANLKYFKAVNRNVPEGKEYVATVSIHAENQDEAFELGKAFVALRKRGIHVTQAGGYGLIIYCAHESDLKLEKSDTYIDDPS